MSDDQRNPEIEGLRIIAGDAFELWAGSIGQPGHVPLWFDDELVALLDVPDE
ncbi:MAG: hypothetical protein ACXWNS_08230 [Isosphaeraceae bacterium]